MLLNTQSLEGMRLREPQKLHLRAYVQNLHVGRKKSSVKSVVILLEAGWHDMHKPQFPWQMIAVPSGHCGVWGSHCYQSWICQLRLYSLRQNTSTAGIAASTPFPTPALILFGDGCCFQKMVFLWTFQTQSLCFSHDWWSSNKYSRSNCSSVLSIQNHSGSFKICNFSLNSVRKGHDRVQGPCSDRKTLKTKVLVLLCHTEEFCGSLQHMGDSLRWHKC